MGRIVPVLLWLLALGGLVAVAVALEQVTGGPAAATGPARSTPSVTPGRRPAPRARAASGSWRVVDHLAAEHVALIHVETDRVREARQIAIALVEPLKRDYSEILVYYHRPGRRHRLPARRVQWSPRGGYVETTYEAPPPPLRPSPPRRGK